MSPVASILLLFAALAAAPPEPSTAGFEESIRLAEEALGQADPATSLSWLDRALRAQPDSPRAMLLLGRTFMALGRREDALAAFDSVAAREGAEERAQVDALYGKAEALAGLERNLEAEEMLKRVLAAAPEHRGVHADLGRIYVAFGRLDEAMREFRAEIAAQKRAGTTAPGVPMDTVLASAWEGLGIAAWRAGDNATALDALSHAPDTAEVLYHRGLALARDGRNEEAARMLRAVLVEEPDHRGALQNLARVARGQERADALSRFQTLYAQDVARNTLRIRVTELRTRAEQRAQAQDYAGADALLLQAAALAPDDVDVKMDLGRWRYRSGDRRGSEAMLREAIALDPMHADAHHLLGRLFGEQGDSAGSIIELERAVGLAPMNAGYHLQLANAYMRAGKVEDGVRELKLAQRLDPDDARTCYNLGLALAQSGDLAAAAAQLDEAVRLGFADPRVHQALARVHQGLGNMERSMKEQTIYERLVAQEGAAPKNDGVPR